MNRAGHIPFQIGVCFLCRGAHMIKLFVASFYEMFRHQAVKEMEEVVIDAVDV